MVLARRTGRTSPLGKAGDCNEAGMRGVLMGEARLKTSLHPAIFPVKRPIDETFVYQRVYTPRAMQCSARLLA
jgi:hypothetical protein